MHTNHPIIFVVGASRTGTTAMARMLRASGRVWMARELHFFERLCPDRLLHEPVNDAGRDRLWRALQHTQAVGIMHEKRPASSATPAQPVPPRQPDEHTPMDVYAAFMRAQAGDGIPCDHTPRNVYYLKEILAKWPDARIIVMLRDPRDVLLSQKNKWKRIHHKDVSMPLREAFRLWINYHPITTSWLWRSSVRAARAWTDHPHVLFCSFEALVSNPAEWGPRIAAHIGIPYHETMLQVPQKGSSHHPNQPEAKGFNADRAQHWKRTGGLNAGELWWCQTLCKRFMSLGGYEPGDSSRGWFFALWYALTWPVKALAAACMNASRMANIKDPLLRRTRKY